MRSTFLGFVSKDRRGEQRVTFTSESALSMLWSATEDQCPYIVQEW